MTTKEALRRLDLLRACTDAELGAVRRLATIVDVPAGTTIHPLGQSLSWLYGILEGTVRVSVAGHWHALRRGGTYGQRELLLDQPPRDVEIVADTAVTVFIVGRPEYFGLFTSAPSAGYAVARELALVSATRGTSEAAI